MKKPRLRGSNAVIFGNAYDIRKTVDVLHRIVCAVMDATGVKKGEVGTRYPNVPKSPLPHPGLAKAEQVWKRLAEAYDVVDEPLIYTMGTLTFRAYLLGKTWSIYRPATGEILTQHGTPAAEIENAPIISVSGYGKCAADGVFGAVSSAQMDLLDKVLEPFSLAVDGVNCNTQEGHTVAQKQYLAFISLPHAVYGAGRRELTVRCVLEGGGEIPQWLVQQQKKKN